jgi:P4 family phage/plasmid primase-like protien
LLTKVFTSPIEFENFIKLLPQTPIFIPIIPNGKKPDVPLGESWKNPQYHLTPEQALDRLKEGKNVGVVANDWLVIIDLDNPEKFKLNIKTLTVETRNGKLHMYFQNAGDVENAVGKNSLAKCGEARAEWQYVLAPGSYVPCDDDKSESGNGLYHIIDSSPLAILHKKDLPEDFIPSTETIEVNPEVLNAEFTTRNKHGWTIDEIRNRDKKLDELLNNQLAGKPSGSEADMATLTKLLFWEFTEGEAVAILKKYRYRPKLERADYITNMLGHISRNETISNKIDPKKWNPKTGYMIDLVFSNQQENTQTPTNDSKNIVELIIEIFKQKYIFKTPTDTEELHYYDDGIYKPAEHKIKKELETELGAKISTHHANEIIEHLKWHSYINREEFNKYNGLIPLQNGLFNLETLTLNPFDSTQIFTFKLPVSYDPDADCPQFKQWLTEVQTPDNIIILQEYAGYSLLPKMPFHKSIWFIGEGRNGKGTFIHTLEGIIGKHNIANVALQELTGERNFSEYQLYGKLINISSEPTTKKELETPLFKKLTGDDTIAAEVKCKQNRVCFTNFAKFYILGNKYPRVRDNTTAFKQRLIIIKWENIFLEGKNQIQHIEKRWLNNPAEKAGILKWMLQGLHRLVQNEKFSMTKTQEEMMIEFERASDSIAAWIDERLIFNRETFVEREASFNDYMEYCDYYGIYQADKKKVFERLRNTPKIKDMSARILGQKSRVWKGIELKPKLNIEEQDELTLPKEQQKLVSGTVGTLGTCKNKSKKSTDNIVKENELQNAVPTVPSVPYRVCGDCGRFRTPACFYPGGNFEKMSSDSGWACECHGWIERQPDLPEYREGADV